ncbi:hypothetical protein BH11PSE10_BH11PSE10_18030 [soil metagenome]
MRTRHPLIALLLCCAAFAAFAALAQPVQEGGAIIVALSDQRGAQPGVGGTPRAGYRRGAGYATGLGTEAEAEALAREFGLTREGAWTIAPLQLFCLLLRLPAGADQAAVLAALSADPRVQLAQPLNSFETLAETAGPPAYNDPYLGLQRGFEAMGVAEAQRFTRGEGVRVALIDTGLDGSHPDLQGRITSQRDFVGPAHPPAEQAERHGTQMAGVLAAVANNRVGIVGIAPQAQLLAYRACWEIASPPGAARCDSFTLARALGAAIAADPDIINLSLGGPPDPLLARLAEVAVRRGIIVVGAVPPGGRQDGFPIGVAGVLAVRSSDDLQPGSKAVAAPLTAPGRDILSLLPGGGYDFASGSSFAAAQVSGAVALLRALQPRLTGETAQRLLAGEAAAKGAANACAAVRQLRAAAACAVIERAEPGR